VITGGYYIKSRKIQESEIAFAPPHVREIWDWLIREANHKDAGNFKRGECFRSLQDIREGLKWYVGYRREMYSKSKCEMAMNWLRKRGMITTTKTTRGMHISICNYDRYQDPKNYESNKNDDTKETRKEQPSDTINKNDKNDKKKENTFTPPSVEDVKKYFDEKGYIPEVGKKAFDYYDSAGWVDSKGNKIKNWKQKMIGVWFKDENKKPIKQLSI